VRRLHQRFATRWDNPLPDRESEVREPERADRLYDEAVAVLRERTRETSRFPLIFAENIEYGFRRNSLGLRPIALAIAVVALIASIVLLLRGSGSPGARLARWGTSGVVSTLSMLYWWRIVSPEWVRRAGELYATRLFEAVDTLRTDVTRS
jgi:hypothetical protein